jgi:hypothetical protein
MMWCRRPPCRARAGRQGAPINALVLQSFDGWRPALYAALKALALFVTAVAAFRLTLRRTIAEFTPFDWVTAVAVGAIVGRTATAGDTSRLTGAAALLTLIAAPDTVARLRFIPWIHRLVDPPVRVLIRDGEVNHTTCSAAGSPATTSMRSCANTATDRPPILGWRCSKRKAWFGFSPIARRSNADRSRPAQVPDPTGPPSG